MKLKIAICDDNERDLTKEKELIEKNIPLKNYEIHCYKQADGLLGSITEYDMIFLDIEIGKINGIKTAKELHKKSPNTLIFFVTNHEDYMDEALDNHAFRFWVKPINETRLKYGLQSAIKKIESKNHKIKVMLGTTEIKLPVSEIICVYHENRQTHVIMTDKEISSYDSYRSITEQIDADYFVQTHASYMVNLNYVSDYSKTEIICEHEGKVYKLYISRRKYGEFKDKFIKWSSSEE